MLNSENIKKKFQISQNLSSSEINRISNHVKTLPSIPTGNNYQFQQQQQTSYQKIKECEQISAFASDYYHIDNDQHITADSQKKVIQLKAFIKNKIETKNQLKLFNQSNQKHKLQFNKKQVENINIDDNHDLNSFQKVYPLKFYNQWDDLKSNQRKFDQYMKHVKNQLSADSLQFTQIRKFIDLQHQETLVSDVVNEQLKKLHLDPTDERFQKFVQKLKDFQFQQEKYSKYQNENIKAILKPALSSRVEMNYIQQSYPQSANNQNSQTKLYTEDTKCKIEEKQYKIQKNHISRLFKKRTQSLELKQNQSNQQEALKKVKMILKSQQKSRQKNAARLSTQLKTVEQEIIKKFEDYQYDQNNQKINDLISANERMQSYPQYEPLIIQPSQLIHSFRHWISKEKFEKGILSDQEFAQMKLEIKINKLSSKSYLTKINKYALEKELKKNGLTLQTFLEHSNFKIKT